MLCFDIFSQKGLATSLILATVVSGVNWQLASLQKLKNSKNNSKSPVRGVFGAYF